MPTLDFPDRTETFGDPNSQLTAAIINLIKSVVNGKAEGDHTHAVATTTADGFMGFSDKVALNSAVASITSIFATLANVILATDPRLVDARNLKVITGMGRAPTATDDTAAGRAIGNAWSHNGDLWFCASAANGAAVWKKVDGTGSGIAVITGTADPAAVPPSAPAFFHRTDTDAVWVALETGSVADWLPLVTTGTPMRASVHNPEGKTSQYVGEDEIEDFIRDDDLVDPNQIVVESGSLVDASLNHNGKRVRLVGTSPRLRIPPQSEVPFPANFSASYSCRNQWQLTAPTPVAVNGATAPALSIPQLPNELDLWNTSPDDWEYSSLATSTATAPTAGSALSNQSYNVSTGIRTIEAAPAFSGSGITYSLQSPPTGVTIVPESGTISVNTATTGALSGVTITVRATNVAGFLDRTFTLTVVSAFSISGGTESFPTGYKVATFEANGNLVISGSGTLFYELVGGGGAAGYSRGGGGGGGGVISGSLPVTPGTLAVVVGAGGPSNLTFLAAGSSGTATSVAALSLTAPGGGGGGAAGDGAGDQPGKNGGNGGGGGGSNNVAPGNGDSVAGIGSPGNDGGAGGQSSTSGNRTGGGGGGAAADGTPGIAGGAGGAGGAGIDSVCPGVVAKHGAGGGGLAHNSAGVGGVGGAGGGGNGGFGTTAPNAVGQHATGFGNGGGGGHVTRGGSGSPGIARFWIGVA